MVYVTKIMDILYIVPALITYIVGYTLIKYPISISEPTERGMHKNNIISSGGIAILVGIISFTVLAGLDNNSLLNNNEIIYISAFMLVTIIGYFDDTRSLSKKFRFGAQIFISYLVLQTTSIFDPFLILAAIILIVYTINIYNFMDGIDQLAISQAIFFAASSGLIFWWENFTFSLIFLSFFLINYKKTKIFLGNSGSYLLGLYVAVAIISGPRETIYEEGALISMFILMTIFYVEATYTIIARFLKKLFSDATILESIIHVTNAHRTHVYQKLAVKFNSHSKVVLLMMTYNILWCLPLAYTAFRYDYLLLPLMLSYIPYIYYCYLNKSGTES